MGLLIKGADGAVYRAGKEIFKINSANLNSANGIENTTDFGSDGVERDYTGVVDFTGSIAGQFPLTDTSTGGTLDSQQVAMTELSGAGSTVSKALWKFIESSLSMWFGTMLVSDWSKTNSAEGLQAFTANVVADGRMTYATSTST